MRDGLGITEIAQDTDGPTSEMVAWIVEHGDHCVDRAMILGPAFGRLLPSPFLIPWAFEVTTMAGLIFPLIAIAREWRQGAVHPAWRWGLPLLPFMLLLGYGLGHSAFAGEIYGWVTAGTPGAAIDPLAYGAPPPGL